MMDTAILRSRILDLAIRGKLVEQDPSEGTAEELLKEIGKQRGKTIEPITDDVPFEIPDSWRWVRFGNIAINRDSERIPLSVSVRSRLEKTYDYYGASGVIDKVDRYLFDKPLLLIGEDGANLVSRNTPIAFIAKGQYWVNNHAHVLDFINEGLMVFICYYINAISLSDYITGSAQPKMNQEKMNSIPLALPPLSEQKRIVERVEELLKLVDAIETAQTDIKQISSIFRSRVLDKAIRGKLVPQDTSEGTADNLIKEIAKQRGKTIVPITDEVPFEIPDSWRWVALGDLGGDCRHPFADGPFGSNLKTEHYTHNKEVRIIQLSNIGEFGWRDENVKYTTFEHAKLIERSMVEAGDIVIAKMMPAGRSIIVPDIEKAFILSSDAVKFVPSDKIDNKYILNAINSPVVKEQIYAEVSGVTRVRTSLNKLKTYLIPLPPIAEQHRIVAKIEEIFAQIDELTK